MNISIAGYSFNGLLADGSMTAWNAATPAASGGNPLLDPRNERAHQTRRMEK